MVPLVPASCFKSWSGSGEIEFVNIIVINWKDFEYKSGDSDISWRSNFSASQYFNKSYFQFDK